MKLELKHLAPYLPYGLKYVKYSDNNSPIRHDIMQGVSTNGIYACGDITPLSFKNCKPILRPLSDLKSNSFRSYDYLVNENVYSFEEYEFIFKNHFDVFGLIPKFAININTLKQ